MNTLVNENEISPTIEAESLKDQISTILEEARMVLPGIQTLFGFQLIVVFNARFEDLHFELQRLHLVAIMMTVIAVGLLMAPAAYHRIAERHHVSEYFARMASSMIACGMFPLAVALSLDIYVVVQVVVENRAISLGLGLLSYLFYFILWFVFPWWRRQNMA